LKDQIVEASLALTAITKGEWRKRWLPRVKVDPSTAQMIQENLEIRWMEQELWERSRSKYGIAGRW
jgi:hypothetical protein